MAKRRKKLDELLHSRRASHESVLEEKTQLSNFLFRCCVSVVLLLCLIALAGPSTWSAALGLSLLFGALAILGTVSVSRLAPGLFPGPSQFNQFILLVLGTALVYKFILTKGWSPYLTPLPILSMMLGLAYAQAAAVFIVAAMAFYLALLAPFSSGMVLAFPLIDFPMAVVFSLGGVVSVLGVERVRKQSRPVLVGFYCGLIHVLAIFCFELMRVGDALFLDSALREELARDAGFGLVSGIASGAFVTSFLPAIESFLGVVTERRLLDLADPSHKLLRILRERAPGTFQHTLGVQQLAREAAEAIGADVLLTEVGAYYHDIGKIFKPEYFVENMGEDRSIHDRLRPSMSKMIIISHVKDGMILAREERLPQRIIDMIPMHHGTTVVEFFYRKARKQSGEEEETPGEDVSYRYSGPRPRFAEAGILMLADVVEAIAKTMIEPTPNRFRDMVHEVIMKRLEDGQFDLCPLTIADLRKIEDSFVRTLTNMYHNRIRYSEADGDESRDVATTAATRGDRGEPKARPSKNGRPSGGGKPRKEERPEEPPTGRAGDQVVEHVKGAHGQ